jgi:hypothetical protein
LYENGEQVKEAEFCERVALHATAAMISNHISDSFEFLLLQGRVEAFPLRFPSTCGEIPKETGEGEPGTRSTRLYPTTHSYLSHRD